VSHLLVHTALGKVPLGTNTWRRCNLRKWSLWLHKCTSFLDVGRVMVDHARNKECSCCRSCASIKVFVIIGGSARSSSTT